MVQLYLTILKDTFAIYEFKSDSDLFCEKNRNLQRAADSLKDNVHEITQKI